MKKIITVVVLTLFLSSCSLYKIEVQQGNALTNETVSQLKSGMSKDEVASLLGSPLMHDNFRRNRWDYIYYNETGASDNAKKHGITLFFENDRLVKVTK